MSGDRASGASDREYVLVLRPTCAGLLRCIETERIERKLHKEHRLGRTTGEYRCNFIESVVCVNGAAGTDRKIEGNQPLLEERRRGKPRAGITASKSDYVRHLGDPIRPLQLSNDLALLRPIPKMLQKPLP